VVVVALKVQRQSVLEDQQQYLLTKPVPVEQVRHQQLQDHP
jgi:hypothetical protein